MEPWKETAAIAFAIAAVLVAFALSGVFQGRQKLQCIQDNKHRTAEEVERLCKGIA